MDRDELANKVAVAIERFHDALPQGQGETGDGGAAGRQLCQLFYDNADTILLALAEGTGGTAALTTPSETALQDRIAVLEAENAALKERARQGVGEVLSMLGLNEGTTNGK